MNAAHCICLSVALYVCGRFGLLLGLWCLTPLSTIFQLSWWYSEKNTDLPQATDKLDALGYFWEYQKELSIDVTVW